MYVAFGNNIVDSNEIKDTIEKNTEFKIIKDMSKGTKRDDILAYNLSINTKVLNMIIEEECNLDDLTEDELFEEYLSLAEEISTEIEDLLPEEAVLDIKAYKWDESENAIKLIIAIAHEDLKESKMRDIMKRLATQVE
ncbi:hypothetical protein [Clostridium grantii]|uniref:Uncharacterized protein n=1 Tax=Clostridium grantii DSM 8605 TaxID=1121316 RepID=A0A1M5XB30_9CLOT|nr:hypothetical protein [Clostridium grantii]SHH96768.1 hypothetical protein SAMN02745207_03494 [Clostridium grantii DSM 8605]